MIFRPRRGSISEEELRRDSFVVEDARFALPVGDFVAAALHAAVGHHAGGLVIPPETQQEEFVVAGMVEADRQQMPEDAVVLLDGGVDALMDDAVIGPVVVVVLVAAALGAEFPVPAASVGELIPTFETMLFHRAHIVAFSAAR